MPDHGFMLYCTTERQNCDLIQFIYCKYLSYVQGDGQNTYKYLKYIQKYKTIAALSQN